MVSLGHRDETLAGEGGHGRKQTPPSLLVQLARHIIQQQEWRFSQHLTQVFQLRQFESEHQRAKLTLRRVFARQMASQFQLQIICLGPNPVKPRL